MHSHTIQYDSIYVIIQYGHPLLPLKFVHVDKGLLVHLSIREFLHSKDVLAVIVPLYLLEYVNIVLYQVWVTKSISRLIGLLVAMAFAKDIPVFAANASVQACNALDIWFSLGLMRERRTLSRTVVERHRFSPQVGIRPDSSSFVSISGVALTCTPALINSSSNSRSSSEPGSS